MRDTIPNERRHDHGPGPPGGNPMEILGFFGNPKLRIETRALEKGVPLDHQRGRETDIDTEQQGEQVTGKKLDGSSAVLYAAGR